MKLRGVVIIVGAIAASSLGATAFAANPHNTPNNPNPTGQPTQHCGSPSALNTPGNAVNSPGSVFNANGQSGTVYAGQPGTPSAANGNSHAVSQYDVACFQQP